MTNEERSIRAVIGNYSVTTSDDDRAALIAAMLAEIAVQLIHLNEKLDGLKPLLNENLTSLTRTMQRYKEMREGL